jgi:cell division protein FtsA
VVGLPVRIGQPHNLQGLVDVLMNPAYASSVGLLLWGQRQQPAAVREPPPSVTVASRMARWFRNLLPD